MEKYRIPATRSQGRPVCRQDERRKQQRLHCKGVAEVRVLSIEANIQGILLDLSVSGCCIETSTPFPPIENPCVEVRLHVKGTTLRVAGVVRHVKKDSHAGIEFIDVTARKAEQIKGLIKELLEMEYDCFVNAREAEEESPYA